MRSMRAALGILGLTLLAGCVTDPGYAPMDATKGQYFGYVDQPNGDGGHTIRVVLPEVARDPRSAFAHWERRAAELCGPAGYRKLVHTARRNMLTVPGYSPTGHSYEVMGDAWCNDPAYTPAPAPAPAAPAG
jgi:hypothetical protein